MANTNRIVGSRLFDAVGNWIGMLGLNGQENTLPPVVNQAAVAITGGNINATAIGQTTPAAVKTSNLQATYSDSSGTPGNVTNNSPRGRVAVAAAVNTIVVTNSLVAATSAIMCNLRSIDGALASTLGSLLLDLGGLARTACVAQAAHVT